ncbi:MAG: D-alanyl-D-alanine carboxypeptidase/D-alanyl-D-alanine endopeptidase [Gemmobacter sp.]
MSLRDPTRRAILAGLAASVALPVAGAGVPIPPPRPPGLGAPAVAAPGAVAAGTEARLIAEARLGGGAGVALIVASSGETLAEAAGSAALPPASSLKALTALYALDALGGAHRFATRLLATGAVQGGTLAGDLILAGGGDPALDADDLARLAAACVAAGIVRVDGRFLYHGGAMPEIARIDPAQPAQAGYNPGVGGLNLNFNRVHLEWARQGEGWRIALDARGLEQRPPGGRGRGSVVESRPGPMFVHRVRPGREEWEVTQGALGAEGTLWLPVRQPGLYAAEVFRTLAAQAGLALPEPAPGAPPPEAREIARHEGQPLARELTSMLRFSTNLSAEAVGLAASGAPDLAASGRAMADWVSRRLGAEAEFVDHSGLGAGSRIAPLAMARALAQAGAEGPLPPLLRDHPLPEGTPRGTSVKAKTGTLDYVSTLAGYLRMPSGRVGAFAILAADLESRARLRREDGGRTPGARSWAGRAREMQRRTLLHWARTFG